MLPSSQSGLVTWPARNAAFFVYQIILVPGPLSGMFPTPNVPSARRPPSVSNENEVGIVVPPPPALAPGRGPPAVPCGSNANVPLLPALSRQLPLIVAGLIVASRLTGRGGPGLLTTLSPKVIVPLGCGTAMPCTGSRGLPPHCSSKPSSVNPEPFWVTTSVRTLQ